MSGNEEMIDDEISINKWDQKGIFKSVKEIEIEKYYYQIIVFTGLRKDAGTSSKVK